MFEPLFQPSKQSLTLSPFIFLHRNMSLGAKAEIATDKLSFPLKNTTREHIAKMIAGNNTESSRTPV